jgi:hypothetical protein
MRSLLVGLLSFGLLSCERDREAPINLGVSEKTIIAAQEKYLNELNPYTIEQGQRVHSIETQELITAQGPQKIVTKEWTTEVIEVDNDPETRFIKTHKQVIDRTWDEDFIYEFKSLYFLRQIDSLQLLDQLDLNRLSMSSLISRSLKANQVASEEVDGISFQNLNEQEVMLVPPELVKNSENCKGIPDCRIPANVMTYDIVLRMKDGTRRTQKIEWIISGEVPYFASLLKDCASTVLTIEGIRVLIKQCSEVVDF